VWEAKRGYPYVPTMLTYGEHLYVVNDKGVASCHVAATGEKVWTHRLGGDVTASPILIDGKIYAIDENGAVFVFAAAPEFKLVGKSEIGEPVMATPAVADNRLFIRTSKQVLCIGKPAEKQANAR
ncbi:MAG TPA: PQQ-binding-like beta-propeller repeat protein, partial [Gemmataceae bacterium]|nr:PQQ-binding-like beta-propeller repeat protein [Gemmataceae bacterium]